MDNQSMLEEITRLVIQELEKISGNTSVSPDVNSANFLVVLDPEMAEFSSLMDILQKIGGKANYRIVVDDKRAGALKQAAGNFPYIPVINVERQDYGKIIRGIDRIIIPLLSVTCLSKIASLTGDEPVPGICIQGLLSGIPVTVCTDNIHSLKFSDCVRPKKLLAMVQAHLTVIQEMGIEPVQLQKLPETVKDKKREKEISPAAMKNVITNEDVMTAVHQKVKDINFPRGTIITPLARETARNYGIEINIV
jgi:hypothetical protein